MTATKVADKARVNWDLVLKTDATPYQGDWDKLMLLVGRAMPIVEAQLATPILSPGQRSRIPESWLQSQHRAGAVPLR